MKKRIVIILLSIFLSIILIGLTVALSLNAYVKGVGKKYIISSDEATELEGVDCILVLGCLVKNNGEPSDMLADRIRRGVELYKNGAAPKIIMSGDHGRTSYDEVNTMKQSAIDDGVKSSDVFMDHAGFSTYESIYRAKEIFGVKKMIIVTQDYHLYRALYIAESLGIEAYGVNADYREYWGQCKRDMREVLARCKDFATVIFKPTPTYLGDMIPISGDGDLTND